MGEDEETDAQRQKKEDAAAIKKWEIESEIRRRERWERDKKKIIKAKVVADVYFRGSQIVERPDPKDELKEISWDFDHKDKAEEFVKTIQSNPHYRRIRIEEVKQ